MEALSGAFKVFAEKHLIPSVISLIVGAIIYLLTPDDSWMIEKLTKLGYWLFVSGCFFIIIQLLIWIKNKIQEKQYNRYLKRSNTEYRKKEAEENLQVLWEYVDGLDQEDRNLLKQFLANKNKPLVIRGNVYYAYGKLLNSHSVHSQKGYDDQGSYTKYVLEESLYNALVVSSELYGKISRFEEV